MRLKFYPSYLKLQVCGVRGLESDGSFNRGARAGAHRRASSDVGGECYWKIASLTRLNQQLRPSSVNNLKK